MTDNSKYDALLSELSALEAQILHMKDSIHSENSRIKELEEELNKAKKENLFLQEKISYLENEIQKPVDNAESKLFSSLNMNEKEVLRSKIKELLNRLNSLASS